MYKQARFLLSKSKMDSSLLDQDLAIAKEVQRASIPRKPPFIRGLNCATFYKPAYSIGGDYYDFLPLSDRGWAVAIGDVSGKGIGAALVVASIQGALRAQVLHGGSDIETQITNVNRLVWECSPQHFFASLFYAEYQPKSRVLRYVNAGHNAPIVIRRRLDGCSLFALRPQSAPVGLLKESRFTSTTFQFEIDDVLLAYTDGVTESENSSGIAFGHKRLEMILRDCEPKDAHTILRVILGELSVHSAGCPQVDDMTAVVIQVQAFERKKSLAPWSQSASSSARSRFG